MKRRARAISLSWILLVLVGVAGPEMAAAQSAADKATARQLATEGIQLFQKERYADALDKLERAESLFDAPVHLLYIARSHAKLNHLVEAAEAYRRLVRTELPANAPQTFKDAVADGQKELGELEAQIPSLQVQVTPANAKDLRLSIDGESVSTAVIGVDRPVNPGAHVIEVTSGHQAPVSRRVEIAIGSKQVVKLELPSTTEVSDGAAASGGAANPESTARTPLGTSQSADGASQVATLPTNQPARRRRLRLVAGIDAAGVLPFGGKLDKLSGYGTADDRSVTGRFGAGGGAELRLGVSIPIGQLAITPLVFFNANSHTPGSLYKSSADASFGLKSGEYNSVMKTEPLSGALGLGVRFDTAPQELYQLGAFGELGLLLAQIYSTETSWVIPDTGQECSFSERFSGAGVRLRGGILFPVSSLISLNGSAGVSVVSLSKTGIADKSCNQGDGLAALTRDDSEIPSDSRSLHAILGLNLGAEFGIGL